MPYTKEQANSMLATVKTEGGLHNLVSQLDIHAEGKVTMLYSATTADGVHSTDIINGMLLNGEDIRVIDKTEAAKFLDHRKNKKFRNTLQRVFNDDPNVRGSKANQFLFGGTDANGNRIPNGAWDNASKRFAAATTGDIRTLSRNASKYGVLAQSELPEVLSMDKATSVDGIKLSELKKMEPGKAFESIKTQSAIDAGDLKVATEGKGKPMVVNGAARVDTREYFEKTPGMKGTKPVINTPMTKVAALAQPKLAAPKPKAAHLEKAAIGAAAAGSAGCGLGAIMIGFGAGPIIETALDVAGTPLMRALRVGAMEASSPMPFNGGQGPLAATVDHQIDHPSFAAALVGAAVGGLLAAAVFIAAGALVAATGGAALAVAAGTMALGTAGIFALGGVIGKASSSVTNFLDGLSPPNDGPIITGSANVFIEGKPAARAGVDTVACTKHGHKPPLIAQGSGNVYVNSHRAARIDDKIECSGIIKQGATSVKIGGGQGGVAGLEIAESFSPLQKLTLMAVEFLVPPSRGFATALAKAPGKILGRLSAKGAKGVLKGALPGARLAARQAGKAAVNCVKRSAKQTSRALRTAYTGALKTTGRAAARVKQRISHLSGKSRGKPNNCTKGCGDPVDVANGDFIDTRTDFVIPATLPIVFNRSYRSKSEASGQLGLKWSNSWSQHLVVDGDEIHFHNEEGNRITFENPGHELSAGHLRYPHLTLYGHKQQGIALYNEREQRSYQFAYEAKGRLWLTQIQDRNDNHIRFYYNSEGLHKVSHSDGLELQIQSRDWIIEQVNLLEDKTLSHHLVAYHYQDGYLSHVESLQNGIFKYEYDHRGRMTAWSDSKDTRVSYVYDERSRIIHTASTAGYHNVEFHYDDSTNATTVHYPEGQQETFYYNADGLVTRHIDGNGQEWLTGWDEQFNIVSETDPLGQRQTWGYDDQGQLLSQTDAAGRTSRFQHTPDGLIESVTDAEGNRWHYEYDDRGNLSSLTNPLGEHQQFHYTASGQIQQIDLPNGAQQRFSYDARHQPRQQIDANGNPSQLRYDNLGRLLQHEDAEGQLTRYEYSTRPGNPRGNLSTIIQADDSRIGYAYDTEGQIERITDAEGHSTRYQHGAFDLLKSVTDPQGQTLHYEYDSHTRFKALINASNERYEYRYDAAGNMIRETDFSGLITHYQYDTANRLIEKTDPDKTRHTYHYDAGGLLLQAVSTPPGHGRKTITTNYDYNANGQMISADNGEALLEYTYDALGRVLTESLNGQTIQSHYQSGEQQRKARSGAASPLVFRYDPNGQLQQLGIDKNQPLLLQRNRQGQVETRHSQSGFLGAQRYDPLGRLSQQLAGAAADIAPYLEQYSGIAVIPGQAQVSRQYQWDHNDNPTQIQDQRRGQQSWQYDSRQQITQATHGFGLNQQPQQEQFHYGHNQQITQAQQNQHSEHYRYLHGGRLLERGLFQYRYDQAGRMLERTLQKKGFRPKTWRYTWNAEGRLSKVSTPEGEQWFYQYDALGRRIRKLKGIPTPAAQQPYRDEVDNSPVSEPAQSTEQTGTQYLWDGDNLIQEVPIYADGTVAWDEAEEWVYEPDSLSPVAKKAANGALYYIVTDHLGTPKELISEDGKHTAWAGQQTVWGKYTGNMAKLGRDRSTSNDPDYTNCPIRFPGQWEDEESGLHYNRHRYYDPEAGQYISPDPIGLEGGTNPQAYVHNPNGWVDPLGLAGCGGAKGLTDTNTIRFTQDTAGKVVNGKASFSDGRPIKGMIDDLRSGNLKPANVKPIRTFVQDGKAYTLDNRRLLAHHQAGVKINTRPATATELSIELGSKFTTRNDGTIIGIRGSLE